MLRDEPGLINSGLWVVMAIRRVLRLFRNKTLADQRLAHMKLTASLRGVQDRLVSRMRCSAELFAQRCTADPGPPRTMTVPGLQRTTSP